jgi:hypothetical protein
MKYTSLFESLILLTPFFAIFLYQVPNVSKNQAVSPTARYRSHRTHAGAESAKWAVVVAG